VRHVLLVTVATAGSGTAAWPASSSAAPCAGSDVPVPLRDAVGTTESTGIFGDDGTLTFLGGSQEGTGI